MTEFDFHVAVPKSGVVGAHVVSPCSLRIKMKCGAAGFFDLSLDGAIAGRSA